MTTVTHGQGPALQGNAGSGRHDSDVKNLNLKVTAARSAATLDARRYHRFRDWH